MTKHKWYPIPLAAVCFLLGASFLACTELTTSPTFLTYTDEINGFSISYPQDWEIMSEDRLQGPQIVAFWTPAAEHEGKPLFTLAREEETGQEEEYTERNVSEYILKEQETEQAEVGEE